MNDQDISVTFDSAALK